MVSGEAEILYGRYTKWKVAFVDNSELEGDWIKNNPKLKPSVYVCHQQVRVNSATVKLDRVKSSWSGQPFKHTSEGEFDKIDPKLADNFENKIDSLYDKAKLADWKPKPYEGRA